MAHVKTQLEKQIQKRLKALAGPLLKQRLQWLQPYPIGVDVESTVTIDKRRWSKLGGLAQRWRSAADRDLRTMAGHQKEWSNLWKELQDLQAKLSKTWREPGSLPHWPDVRARMLQDAHLHGLTTAQVQAKLDIFERASVADVFRQTATPVVWFGRQLNGAVIGRLCALAAADLAELVSQFNLAVGQETATTPHTGLGITSTSEILSLVESIHSALTTAKRPAVLTKALRVEKGVTKITHRLVLAAAYFARKDDGAIHMLRGKQAIAIANALRTALLAKSIARLATWMGSWEQRSPFFQEWADAAKRTSFRSTQPEIPVTALSDVVHNPGAFNNKRITVEGRIGPIVIKHVGTKAISMTTITDETGDHISIGLPHFKIDSGGLVMGAYARITGRFATTHADFITAVLVPDRRDLTEDAKTSWLDWASLEVAPIFSPVSHNLMFDFSWSAGIRGPGNQLQYSTWASHQRRQVSVG